MSLGPEVIVFLAGNKRQGQIANLFAHGWLVVVIADQFVQQFFAQLVEFKAAALAWMGQGDVAYA